MAGARSTATMRASITTGSIPSSAWGCSTLGSRTATPTRIRIRTTFPTRTRHPWSWRRSRPWSCRSRSGAKSSTRPGSTCSTATGSTIPGSGSGSRRHHHRRPHQRRRPVVGTVPAALLAHDQRWHAESAAKLHPRLSVPGTQHTITIRSSYRVPAATPGVRPAERIAVHTRVAVV